MYIPQIQTRPEYDNIIFTSNTPSWLNACANIIIIGMTAVIIRQNYKLIQLNEQKIAEDRENIKILQEINENLKNN